MDDLGDVDSPLAHAVDYETSDEDEPIPTLALGEARAARARKAGKREDRSKMMDYARSLPYACETLEEFDGRVAAVVARLVACVRTKDWDVGFVQWNHKLQCLLSLKYPLERTTRARLARIYYHVAVLPGLETRIVELAANTCMALIESKKRINNHDLVLPWRPLHALLVKELFPKTRRSDRSRISETLLDLAEAAQRLFDPDATEEMLQTFLPRLNGGSINSVIATQAFLVHFLPLSHPQRWLPTMFRLWQTFSSSLFDDQMLDLLARLAELHVAEPGASSPSARRKVASQADWVEGIGKGKRREVDEARPAEDDEDDEGYPGLWSDVGIFTAEQYALLMTKCLRGMGVPVGSSKAASSALMGQSVGTAPSGADASASGLTLQMKKPSDRLHSFSVIIAYSIMHDGPVSPPSTAAPTPGTSTPAQSAAPGASNGALSGQPTYLAGSRALDQLAKLVQATETSYHPSNWGLWQINLTSFVSNLTWEVLKRSKEEQSDSCKTPPERRLTPAILTEFVKTLRTVTLMSMFSKDPMSIASSQSSLKRMALLEPDLIFPAVLERSFNSLEALETTSRTTAIITALSTLSMGMVSRELWRPGGKHLAPLLHATLLGLDINDPLKSMSSSLFILNSCLLVKLDDLTRPELASAADDLARTAGESSMQIDAPPADDGRPTAAEEDDALRMSTAELEDWIVTFFRRVLALFEALPEEGKGGKTGGKSEEHVVNTLLAACDTVCSAMSGHFFDLTFRLVAEYCATTVNATAVRVIGALVSCFARADSKKVLDRLVPLCADQIESELASGASSERTTSTSIPVASDAALHWHLSILIGAMANAGTGLLPHRERLLALLQVTIDKTQTERGYSFVARLVQRLVTSLVGLYPGEQRAWSPEQWGSAEMEARSHLHWGQMCLAKDANLSWHVPSAEEIEFALEILAQVGGRALDTVERLQQPGATRDKKWSNDFCRALTYARSCFVSVANMAEEDEEGGGAAAMDCGDEVPEFIAIPPRYKAGFILTDRADARYKTVMAFRKRFGETLHRAAQGTQESAAEDQIDCVKLLVRSIRAYMITYAHNGEDFKSHGRSLAFFRSISKMYAKQRLHPRIFWIRRAVHYHTSRARLASFHRRRSALDDALIADVLELCLSNYVGIRKTAQNALIDIASYYDGTRVLCLPKLLDAVKLTAAQGTSDKNDDRFKGALIVLGSKGFMNMCLVDARFTTRYILALLSAQNHSKPSIQKLVRIALENVLARLHSPTRIELQSSELDEALSLAEQVPQYERVGADLLDAVAARRTQRLKTINEMYTELTPRLLELAQAPETHWAYALVALRLLRAIGVRSDEPLRADLATYLGSQVISENPKTRRSAQLAVTKVLYTLKLRSLCKDDAAIVAGEPSNPLKDEEQLTLPVSREWNDAHWASFAQGTLEPGVRLIDKTTSGWLVWGDKLSYYSAPPEDAPAFAWEEASMGAVDALRDCIRSEAWWEAFARHLSQEKDRDYLSGESVDLIKSLSQVFGAEVLPNLQPRVLALISQADRHGHRAAGELLGGCLRGSKHWPLKAQRELWSFVSDLLPRIFRESTPDSQPAWQMMVEHCLGQRDPRRATPLLHFVIDAAREALAEDATGISPWEQSKRLGMLRGVERSLGNKFFAWTPEFTQLFTDALSSDYAEVRINISEGLVDLDLLRATPSFGSVSLLLDSCTTGTGSLFAKPEVYAGRLAKIQAALSEWRPQRVPVAMGTSKYDRGALTTLMWISASMGDHRVSALPDLAIDFLPHIFEMLELQDNAELQATARRVLYRMACFPWSAPSAARFISALLSVVRASRDSWRTRLDVLPVLQVAFFQNLFSLEQTAIHQIVELLFELLADAHLEVREMAATTLGGIVRCSQRQIIATLRKRFTATILSVQLPHRNEPGFAAALLKLHSGILGVTALLSAFPYEVPSWMPALICETLVHHDDSPPPVSTTVRKAAADFKRFHQDTWEQDAPLFGDRLSEVSEWARGSSSYFA